MRWRRWLTIDKWELLANLKVGLYRKRKKREKDNAEAQRARRFRRGRLGSWPI
jgi:hypothetical protein